MLRKMLVGLDDSAYSKSATRLGIHWAKRFDAELVGVAIVDEQTIRAPEPVPLGAGHYKVERDEALVANAHQNVERILQDFTKLCEQSGVTASTIKGVGLPSEQILQHAHSHDLVLLGQQTYFHFETHDRPCETLEAVIKNTHRPLVIVPEEVPEGRSILIAYDGSPQATRALQLFLLLRLEGDHPIHVISVHSEYPNAERCAQQAVEYLSSHQVEANCRAVASPAATADVIQELAEELEASLIVMGAYGRSAFREFLRGSTTQRLLNESKVPLFTYH